MSSGRKFFKAFIPFLFLLSSFSNLRGGNIELSKIPHEEKEQIQKLFSYLIFDEGFAFVLFGSKPIATIAHDKTTPESYRELYQHPLFNLQSWWTTWEKYQHLFPTKDFLFLAQENERWFEIFLINRTSCLKVIKNNLSLFREKLGVKSSAEEIFEQIVSSKALFGEGLKGSHALFGLLLGYGKRNAIGFETSFSLRRRNLRSKNSCEIVSVEEEELMVPCFSSFSDRETRKVVNKYHHERENILDYYSRGDFLEITMGRLIFSFEK